MPFKNAEDKKKYCEEYRKKNKETINLKRKRKVVCCCGVICSWNSLSSHRKSKQHKQYENGTPKKEFNEMSECLIVDTDEEDDNKTIIEKQKEKPIWEQYCRQCGNIIEKHSIKKLVSCGLIENNDMVEFLKKIKN